jgi:hypothetical protein
MSTKFIPFTLPYRISKEIYVKNNILLFNSTKNLNYSNNKQNDTLYKVENILKINRGYINIIQGNNKLLFIEHKKINEFHYIITKENDDEKVDTIFNYGVINFGLINYNNLIKYQIDLDKNRFYDIYKHKNNEYFYFKLEK